MTETRREKAGADARFEAEAEARERDKERAAQLLFYSITTYHCPCDRLDLLHPACRDAGMCVGKKDE